MLRKQLTVILGLPAKAGDKAILDRARVLADAFLRESEEDAENRRVNKLVSQSVGSLTQRQARSVLKFHRDFAIAHPRLADTKLPMMQRLNLTPKNA
jgi:hypothetical protein